MKALAEQTAKATGEIGQPLAGVRGRGPRGRALRLGDPALGALLFLRRFSTFLTSPHQGGQGGAWGVGRRALGLSVEAGTRAPGSLVVLSCPRSCVVAC